MAILSFFTGPLGKIVGIGLAVVALVGLLWVAKSNYDSRIKAEATIEYNQKQLEQAVADNEKYQQLLADIEKEKAVLVEDLQKKTVEIDEKVDQAKEAISKIPDADKESSEVLKEAVKQLKEKFGK